MNDDDDDFHFVWNYRIVNDKSGNNGEDWYCIKEVCYDDLGKPTGYGDPCVGSEDMDGMRRVWGMISEALELPPLEEDDFTTKETEA